tara:strand:+ start:68 stop:949 length:882 start_codon:yes stop_codon:yes gene_type:complete
MKTILITGGAGFIASNLIKLFVSKDEIHKIYSLDNYSTGKKENKIKSRKITYLRGSTLNINSNKTLKRIKFDTVFHLAEFSRIVPSFTHLDECWENNTLGTFEVIKFTLKKEAKLIYSASSSTLGKNKYLSPYSWTKYSNNELIKNFSKWYDLNYVIVYYYNVYGKNQIISGHMAAVIGIFERQYLLNKPLTIANPGTQKRDFTHVEDIAIGTYLAAKKSNNAEFHIGCGKNYSIKEVAEMFNHPTIMVDERPGERFIGLSNSNKAKRILGYKPKHDLRTYIKNFIKKNEKEK